MELKFSKIRNVKSPVRGTEYSAGIDFFVPEFDEKFIKDLKDKNKNVYIIDNSIVLHPHHQILIPSGIYVSIPSGHALIAHNKSGVAVKKSLDILACVIDEDYQGEVHINLYNTSNEKVKIEQNEKIVQFLLIPINYSKIVELPFNELYSNKTSRGSGGFGSTGSF